VISPVAFAPAVVAVTIKPSGASTNEFSPNAVVAAIAEPVAEAELAAALYSSTSSATTVPSAFVCKLHVLLIQLYLNQVLHDLIFHQ